MRSDRRELQRHGIAMMMVLVSIAMATILATAYLASRDNSAPIGNNVENAAKARWAAMSGLQTGKAILQTKEDWRTNHTAGKLLDSYPLAGGLVTLEARDIETDAPPTSTTKYLELTATATVDGVTQITVGQAYVPIDTGGTVSIDHNELAILVANNIKLSAQAIVTRWPLATQSSLGRRILLATQSLGSGSLQVNDSAAIIDATLYHEIGASGTLVINNSSLPIEQIAYTDQIPLPDAPDCGESDLASALIDVNLTGTSASISSDDRYDDGNLDNAQLTLMGNVTFVIEDTFTLLNNSTVVIDGDVSLVVFNDLIISGNSAIELAPNATLKLYIGDTLILTDSYIGEERPDDTRDSSGYAPVIDVNRIQIFSIDDSVHTLRKFRLNLNSVIKGVVYAPTMEFEIHDDSALYGRVTTIDIIIDGNGALFYDHALDPRIGYTNPDSDLFQSANGDIVSLFETLAALDPSEITSVADALNLQVVAFGQTYGSPLPPGISPPLPPDQPTPRTIPIEFSIISFGTDMIQAEEDKAASSAG